MACTDLHTPGGLKAMPSGQNPWNQLLSTKRGRSKGSLEDLQKRLWKAIRALETGLDDAMARSDGAAVMRWIHCLSQIAGTYTKLTAEADIEVRLKALEARLSDHDQPPTYRASGQARSHRG